MNLDGQGARGSLLDRDSAALANAPINISARPVSGEGFFSDCVVSGYFDIIFLNEDGEARRETAPITTGPGLLAETTSGSNDEYQVVLDNMPGGQYDSIAWYPGSDAS